MSIKDMAISKEERRRFPRVSKSLHIKARLVNAEPEDMPGETVDFSLGGVCIQTARQAPIGGEVHLTFGGLAPELAFSTHGRVAWCLPGKAKDTFETGIELLGMSADKQQRLLALISEEGWAPGTDPEERRYVHLRRHLLVQYRKAGAWLKRSRDNAYSVEVSVHGLVLHTEQKLDRREKLNLHLLLTDGQSEPVECFGNVIQRHQGGKDNDWASTIAFEELSEEGSARLAAFLSRELVNR